MAYKKRRYIRLYVDVWESLVNELDDALLGALVCAMVKYMTGGAIPEFTDKQLATVWPYVKASVDRDLAVCEAKERRAEAKRAARYG